MIKNIFIFTADDELRRSVNRALNILLGMDITRSPRRHSFASEHRKQLPTSEAEKIAFRNYMEEISSCDLIIFWPDECKKNIPFYNYALDIGKKFIPASDVIEAAKTVEILKGLVPLV